jgi:hypothetical protein
MVKQEPSPLENLIGATEADVKATLAVQRFSDR